VFFAYNDGALASPEEKLAPKIRPHVRRPKKGKMGKKILYVRRRKKLTIKLKK
jgi:hypothetical protein